MASEIKVDTIVNAGGDNDSGIDLGTNDTVKIKIANAVKAEVDSSGHVKLDTIKGYTSAASISVVGEGGSNTTNLQQGLCKAWVNFNATSSPIATRESLNIASLTDDASTGQVRLNFTNNFGNTNYTNMGATAGTGGTTGDHSYVPYNTASGGTTSQTFQMRPSLHEGTRVDATYVYHASFGDLA